MIEIKRSFARSLAVMNLLLADQDEITEENYWTIGAFQNGREQVISITNSTKCFYVAEHRSPSNIVVYFGEYVPKVHDDMDIWEHPRFFGNIESAAGYIKTVILGFEENS